MCSKLTWDQRREIEEHEPGSGVPPSYERFGIVNCDNCLRPLQAKSHPDLGVVYSCPLGMHRDRMEIINKIEPTVGLCNAINRDVCITNCSKCKSVIDSRYCNEVFDIRGRYYQCAVCGELCDLTHRAYL